MRNDNEFSNRPTAAVVHLVFGTSMMHDHCRLFMVMAAMVVSGCSGSPEITVHNQTDVPLQNVVLSGSGGLWSPVKALG